MSAPRSPLIALTQAWQDLEHTVNHLLAQGAGPAVDAVDSLQALGRVLATDLVSKVAVPPLDNSAMDGYAVHEADLPALQQPGTALPVAQRIAAGQVGAALAPGQCARIFTGAPVPAGAGAVVMQEHTERLETAAGASVRVTQPVQPGQNIRRAGEDITAGQTVLQRGTRLTPAALGVAASVGAAQLPVFARPRVTVLTTGDELVMPGQPLPPGAIYNSNRHTLMGLVQAAGGVPQDRGVVPDQLEATRQALREAAAHSDLIITSGGVSVGEEDHLRAAVQAEGELQFWALAIKPGKPFVFGHVRRPDGSRCLYMGLPGNPVASFVTFLVLVRPVLGLLAGEGWALPRPLMLPAAFNWPRPDKRREFLRARLNAQGQVEIHPHQGSGVLMSAAWAEGLVDLAPEQVVQAGDTVAWWPYSECLQPRTGA
ncbi:molybdopterin molybdenumtransferase MoeA [Aquabacterium lacunae]|uniref:Molybdopterin molybdenumtransferase n=1 Tax=Aquabacterium lacunae TaxID=2528630 RepID=A0A4Q9H514_9BURK|nr:gephyrin-like molybdotransferase Glp [Aquabacterium lacunae]TBO32680.1 molybdopterin molybdenumtransferase MoeA [Aquabacterium lacunae]